MKARWLSLLVAACCSCGAPPPGFALVDGETATLAATDPQLVDALQSLTFLFFNDADGDNGCAALVEQDAAGLNARNPVSHQGINVEDRQEHAFGAIQGEGRRSFVVLGSVRALSAAEQADPLPVLGGSVVAIGCRELDVVEGQRFHLPVVLFPAGLR